MSSFTGTSDPKSARPQLVFETPSLSKGSISFESPEIPGATAWIVELPQVDLPAFTQRIPRICYVELIAVHWLARSHAKVIRGMARHMNDPVTLPSSQESNLPPPSRLHYVAFAWLFGAAILMTLVAIVVHRSEEEALLRMIERAEPRWLLIALLCQMATYLAQAQIWRAVARAGGVKLPLTSAYRISLAKLFMDQALPTGGLSGSTLVARSLEQLGMPRFLIMASLVVSLVSYYASYVICLILALAIITARGLATIWIWIGALGFAGFAGLIVWSVLRLAQHRPAFIARFERFEFARTRLDALQEAESAVLRNRTLQAQSFAWQILIVVLDAASFWLLLRAVGATAPIAAVFAAFMTASLMRTIGFVPGGLGTFEAAAVFMLKAFGIPATEALSATLLFRALSFWLPMLPGMLFSKSAWPRRFQNHEAMAPEDAWSLELPQLLQTLETSEIGLSQAQAAKRRLVIGPNDLHDRQRHPIMTLLWRQVRSPLLLLLLFAGATSVVTGDWIDAVAVSSILLISVGIGFSREYQANNAAETLRKRVHTLANVWRDGTLQSLPHSELVPGDVFELSAGNLTPADARILQANGFFVSEALLTGESFPVEKRSGTVPPNTILSQRSNCVFQGTSVRSGTAKCLAIQTGRDTALGGIVHQLSLKSTQTEFDRGLLRFGYLVTSAMSVMVLVVLSINLLLGRPLVETLLFSIALAVGMSPELLPAILSVNLARGATMMAQHGVLVRRMNAIENLGSMTVLCTDKTGTLTEGTIGLDGALDAQGTESPYVQELAAINAALQTGLVNPIDHAILQAHRPDLSKIEKLSEIPYDFVRRRLSVIVRSNEQIMIITKGAFHEVLDACTRSSNDQPLDLPTRQNLVDLFGQWSSEGTRVLAIATRDLGADFSGGRDDERDLCFQGFLTFRDPPKEGAAEAIADLARLGVSVKLISGDNKLVSQHVAKQVGLDAQRIITGGELLQMHDEALWSVAESIDLFVEVDPNQKERIILALSKRGHVVGFLGDGINDAPAMHAADTSISVEQAADVAREAADFVLLERHLDIIRRGIEEGRTTFANTLKYVLTTMSANLGNMLSMAVASAFLPFLPLLAGQILLNNLLSDIPALGLAGDSVDRELIARPRRWNMRFIGRFMVEFGLLSSLFDFLTFAVLILAFTASAETFRTAWFLESLLTELLIALVVRTRRPSFRSRPGHFLLLSTVSVLVLALLIPYMPFASMLGFVTLPTEVLLSILAITATYVLITELAKTHLYRNLQEP